MGPLLIRIRHPVCVLGKVGPPREMRLEAPPYPHYTNDSLDSQDPGSVPITYKKTHLSFSPHAGGLTDRQTDGG